MEVKQMATHRLIIPESELLDWIRQRLEYRLERAKVAAVMWDVDFSSSKGPVLAHSLVVDVQIEPQGLSEI